MKLNFHDLQKLPMGFSHCYSSHATMSFSYQPSPMPLDGGGARKSTLLGYHPFFRILPVIRRDQSGNRIGPWFLSWFSGIFSLRVIDFPRHITRLWATLYTQHFLFPLSLPPAPKAQRTKSKETMKETNRAPTTRRNLFEKPRSTSANAPLTNQT